MAIFRERTSTGGLTAFHLVAVLGMGGVLEKQNHESFPVEIKADPVLFRSIYGFHTCLK